MTYTPTDDFTSAYKDAFLKTLFQNPILQDTDECVDSLEFPPNNEPFKFVVEYTETEWLTILSTIMQGAIIIFPNDYHKIWWSFVRQLDCPVDICDLIIACIDDPDSGVADTINNLINVNNESNAREYGQQFENLKLGDGNNPACDNDAWWAGTLNLVQRLNRNNEDVLEIFEVATNSQELVSEVVGDITGVDETSIDAFFAWIQFVQNSIEDNYEAQYTVAYEEAVACDLFCLAIENCELTPVMLFDYFKERLESQLTWGGLIEQTITFLVSGIWTGTEIVDFMMLAQIAFRAQFGRFFDFVGFNDIDADIRIGFNDANNDWETICDECSWIQRWLNGNGNPVDDGWVIIFGEYEGDPERIVDEDASASSASARIRYTFGAGLTTDIERLSLDYSINNPGTTRPVYVRIYDDLDVVQQETEININGVEVGTVNWIGSQTIDEDWYLEFSVGTAINSGGTPHARILGMRVDGTGDDPFE